MSEKGGSECERVRRKKKEPLVLLVLVLVLVLCLKEGRSTKDDHVQSACLRVLVVEIPFNGCLLELFVL
ncbi:hypothetical protein VNO80_26177 [Phaseolus coccineus]|uniref:Uncharacterized protein n=1 Tax=Phaseolus coccineus TaxID=3886 RepID=A0AAN9LE83_PHACN